MSVAVEAVVFKSSHLYETLKALTKYVSRIRGSQSQLPSLTPTASPVL